MSQETRYFLTSLTDVSEFAKAVHSHWGIENGLHWVLDIAFREDESRVRKDHSAQNFAVLRHIALNLLKQERTAKCGIKTKRLKAGWDHDYLLKLLTQ
jgi:predicted transposase YbfD/YdcC